MFIHLSHKYFTGARVDARDTTITRYSPCLPHAYRLEGGSFQLRNGNSWVSGLGDCVHAHATHH